ncbi:MAG: chromate transporter [Firmicutes bacterium]|nr:chromate transporter [Bacillota bacterium]
MSELLNLFLIFAKVGVTTFGGGYAMLPILQREIVEARGWATEEEITDYFAIGQCTPGIIAVNTATFIGYKKRGIPGGIFATLGVIFPSLVIITLIAAFLQNFADFQVVKNAFAGIRVAVCVLILNAVVKLFKKAVTDVPTTVIFCLVLAISVLTNISPVFFVIIAGFAGVIIKSLEAKGKEEQK